MSDPIERVLIETVGRIDVLEIARKAIEDRLIEMRDGRLSMPLRNNGLVVREADGTESSVIRFGPETAVRIGMEAIAAHLAAALRDWLTTDEQVERAGWALHDETCERVDCRGEFCRPEAYLARTALTALTEGSDDHPKFTAFKNKRLQNPAVTASYEEAKARRAGADQ